MKFIPENETTVLNSIRIFGKFNIDNYNFYNDTTFAIEDYICPNIDHELMYKCLQQKQRKNSLADNKSMAQQQHATNKCESIFDHHQQQQVQLNGIDTNCTLIFADADQMLINENNHLNESIVNLTVTESKELIAKTKFDEFFYDNLMGGSGNSSNNVSITSNNANDKNAIVSTNDLNIANMLINNMQQDLAGADVPTERKTNKPTMENKKSKRKFKINNYNGTINLKNISNLTINTGCNRDVVDTMKAIKKYNKTKLNSNVNKLSSTSSSSSSSTTTATTSDNKNVIIHDDVADDDERDSTSYNCEFYNRLLNEIKNSFSQTSVVTENIPTYDRATVSLNSTTTPPTTTSNSLNTSTTSSSSSSASSNSTTTVESQQNYTNMLFRNIQNLRITIPAVGTKGGGGGGGGGEISTTTTNSSNLTISSSNQEGAVEPSDDRPVHIEQWLQQIILETETEPLPNTEILEHSVLNSTKMFGAHSNVMLKVAAAGGNDKA